MEHSRYRPFFASSFRIITDCMTMGCVLRARRIENVKMEHAFGKLTNLEDNCPGVLVWLDHRAVLTPLAAHEKVITEQEEMDFAIAFALAAIRRVHQIAFVN